MTRPIGRAADLSDKTGPLGENGRRGLVCLIGTDGINQGALGQAPGPILGKPSTEGRRIDWVYWGPPIRINRVSRTSVPPIDGHPWGTIE
jgi:hypothetical protein